MADYSQGKIYKLTHGNDVYVGSTVLTLEKRKHNHNYKKDTCSDTLVYKVLGPVWDEVAMELVEEYPCTSKTQLRERERHHAERLKANLNSIRPIRTEG